jgi:hypothetical protein
MIGVANYYGVACRLLTAKVAMEMPIPSVPGLVFQGPEAIIRSTHSPCPSRFAVTHIKGEFIFCAPPNSPVGERT